MHETQETWVPSLDWEETLEVWNGNAQYSYLENPMDGEEPGGLQTMGSQRVRHN